MLHLTVWVVAIILQSVLLGRNMYAVSMGPHALACSAAPAHTLIQAWCRVCPQLVCLTDLENDFINPFDLSSKMNRFVVSTTAARGQHGASGKLGGHRAAVKQECCDSRHQTAAQTASPISLSDCEHLKQLQV